MLHRYLCSALDELRKAVENLNYFTLPIAKRHLKSLVEEIQTGANRMENALEMRDEVEAYERRYKKLKEQIKELKIERTKLREELPNDPKKPDDDELGDLNFTVSRMFRTDDDDNS